MRERVREGIGVKYGEESFKKMRTIVRSQMRRENTSMRRDGGHTWRESTACEGMMVQIRRTNIYACEGDGVKIQ